jgi:outer membrane immunogenic protein
MQRWNVFAGLVAAGSLIGIGSVSAADFPTKAPLTAAAITTNWTGCYFGANAGAGWSDFHQVRTGNVAGVTFPVAQDYGQGTGTGFVVGGQVGCDYQVNNFVVGMQTQFDAGTMKTGNTINYFLPRSFFTSNETKTVGTVTARVGYLVTPTVLAYVKGGGAWAQADLATYGTTRFLFLSESANTVRTGWTVGGGVEWMVSPGWSVFAEYNYMDFGTKTDNYTAGPNTVGTASVFQTRLTTQTALGGVNYHFNWGGPVVAKY